MEIILIFLIVALSFCFLGFFKRDPIMLSFSCFTFVMSGLYSLNNLIPNLIYPYSYWLGMLLIFFGIYIGLRAGIEATFKKRRKKNGQ